MATLTPQALPGVTVGQYLAHDLRAAPAQRRTNRELLAAGSPARERETGPGRAAAPPGPGSGQARQAGRVGIREPSARPLAPECEQILVRGPIPRRDPLGARDSRGTTTQGRKTGLGPGGPPGVCSQ